MKVTNAMKAASRTTSIPVNAVVDFEKEGRSETHDRAPITISAADPLEMRLTRLMESHLRAAQQTSPKDGGALYPAPE